MNFFETDGCDELRVAGCLKCFIVYSIKETSESKMTGSTAAVTANDSDRFTALL